MCLIQGLNQRGNLNMNNFLARHIFSAKRKSKHINKLTNKQTSKQKTNNDNDETKRTNKHIAAFLLCQLLCQRSGRLLSDSPSRSQ